MIEMAELRPGCKRVSYDSLDRNLCARWRLFPACEDVRARRMQAKVAKRLQYELDWAEDVGWEPKVAILTTTREGPCSSTCIDHNGGQMLTIITCIRRK